MKYKRKIKDIRNSIEVEYEYDPIFVSHTHDELQRFGNVKIKSTSFTVSEPIMMIEIAAHLYEVADAEEKEILEKEFDAKPFKIGIVSLERIFVDKVFAAEYYERDILKDFCKHIYDITIMSKLPEIENLFSNIDHLNYLINLKRTEELTRVGGVSSELKISDFKYLNNLDFYKSNKFLNALNYIHNTYVFNQNDYLDINEIIVALTFIKNKFNLEY